MDVTVGAVLGVLFCIIDINCGAKLPTYLTLCSAKDPKLNECLKKNANLAIPQITKGDIHYNIPSLKPLIFSQPFNIKSESDMTLTIHDFILQGLETTKVIDLNFDLTKTVIKMDLEIPNISTAGSYDLKGNAYGFPVWKTGQFHGKLNGVKIQYSNSFVSSKIDDEEFFSILTSNANYTVEKESYDYQGVLNQYYFGSEIREAYKVNVQEVGTEIKAIINKNIANFISDILTGIFSRVPKNDFFKP